MHRLKMVVYVHVCVCVCVCGNIKTPAVVYFPYSLNLVLTVASVG